MEEKPIIAGVDIIFEDDEVPDGTVVGYVRKEDAPQMSRIEELIAYDLTAREGTVVQLFCGLTEEGCLGVEEIARKLEISSERVKQILRKAQRKLDHDKNRIEKLRKFLEE